MEQKRKLKALTSIITAVALIAAFGFGVHLFDKATSSKAANTEETGEVENDFVYLGDHNYEITHNLESYLLIGSDGSGNEDGEDKDGDGKADKYRGDLADFLLLVVFDKTDNTYGFLQIDRNTIASIEMPENGEESDEDTYEQICTARWYGATPEEGCENTVDAVSELLGYFPIDGYYSINMKDIGKLNHQVGGVTVTLEDDLSNKDPELTEGATVKLSDEQAEIFVRSRMDVDDGTNAARMKRQRAYMDAYKEAALKKMGENKDFANELYIELQQDAVTNMPGNRVSACANRMYKGKDLGTFELDGEHKTGETLQDGVEHEEFYPTTSSIIDVLTSLASIEDRGVDEDE